jgi:hypothetical protein
MNKKNFIIASGILMLLILLIGFVNAFGIVSPYWKGNPLKVYPGGSASVDLSLQNMGTNQDVRVRVDLIKGNEVATLEKNEYLVKANTKDTAVLVKVNVPASASVGTTYQVTLTTKTITPGGTGVVFGTGMDTSFDVIVVEKPAAPVETPQVVAETPKEAADYSLIIFSLLVLVIVAAVVITIYMKKGKKAKKSSAKKR